MTTPGKRARWLWLPVVGYCVLLAIRGGLASWAGEPGEAEQAELDLSSAPEVPPPRGYVLRDVVTAKVTAHEPSRLSCGSFADGKTSIGRDAHVSDGVAVDPRAIPYGAMVYIPGVGYRHVDDTGAAMVKEWRRRRRIHIDVRMQTVEDARTWGVKQLSVHVFVPVR